MTVTLIVEKGELQHEPVPLGSGETVVGRHRECTVRIKSPEVSRRHCVLQLEDGCICVEDLGSLNGTFLNGEQIEGRTVIRPGDLLDVGPITFSITLHPEQADLALQRVSGAETIPEADVLEEGTVDMKPGQLQEEGDAPTEDCELRDQRTQLVRTPREEILDNSIDSVRS